MPIPLPNVTKVSRRRLGAEHFHLGDSLRTSRLPASPLAYKPLFEPPDMQEYLRIQQAAKAIRTGLDIWDTQNALDRFRRRVGCLHPWEAWEGDSQRPRRLRSQRPEIDWLNVARGQAVFEISRLIVLRLFQIVCADALESFEDEPENAERFVTQLLTLPGSFSTAVWLALHEGRWRHADSPFAYVRAVATRVHKAESQQDKSMFGPQILSLDLVSPQNPFLTTLLTETEAAVDVNRLLEQQGLFAGLSPDALIIYKLREIHGKNISRRTLPALLEWSTQRVERAWREVSRKMEPRKKLG